MLHAELREDRAFHTTRLMIVKEAAQALERKIIALSNDADRALVDVSSQQR